MKSEVDQCLYLLPKEEEFFRTLMDMTQPKCDGPFCSPKALPQPVPRITAAVQQWGQLGPSDHELALLELLA